MLKLVYGQEHDALTDSLPDLGQEIPFEDVCWAHCQLCGRQSRGREPGILQPVSDGRSQAQEKALHTRINSQRLAVDENGDVSRIVQPDWKLFQDRCLARASLAEQDQRHLLHQRRNVLPDEIEYVLPPDEGGVARLEG